MDAAQQSTPTGAPNRRGPVLRDAPVLPTSPKLTVTKMRVILAELH